MTVDLKLESELSGEPPFQGFAGPDGSEAKNYLRYARARVCARARAALIRLSFRSFRRCGKAWRQIDCESLSARNVTSAAACADRTISREPQRVQATLRPNCRTGTREYLP